MNVDGSGQTNLSAMAFAASFSRDGRRIAFTRRFGGPCRQLGAGDCEVFAMNADGSAQVNLTNNPASDFAPDWARQN